MDQKVKARIVLARANKSNEQIARLNELILYDFEKPLVDYNNNTEIRLRIGDGETSINNLSDLPLGNMHYYDSKPETPEVGDIWYDDIYKYFCLQNKDEIVTLSHPIENIEDGEAPGSVQTANVLSVAGARGFNIIRIDNGAYVLETENINNIAIGDEVSLYLTNNHDFCGIVTNVDVTNKKITIDNFINESISTNELGSVSYLLLYNKPQAGDYIIGNGAWAEGVKTKALSFGAHSEGYDTLAAGKYSHTEGIETKAGYAAHAEGSGTYAKFGSHAEGEDTQALGSYSHAEGQRSKALGLNSHAEGQDTEVNGQAAHTEGYKTKANGTGAHAEGQETTVERITSNGKIEPADGAHAEGYKTRASGNGAHAEGTNTTASGNYSHAEGSNTTSKGPNSHTEGTMTIASGKSQHVQGKYNIEDNEVTVENPEGKYAHIVGNGTGQKRSNAHTLDWDGNAWYAGNVSTEKGIEANYIELTSKFNEEGLPAQAALFVGETNRINEDGGYFNQIYSNSGIFDELTTGAKFYRVDSNGEVTKNGLSPIITYRGEVNTLTDITDQKIGDVICINNLVKQRLVEFKIPKGIDTTIENTNWGFSLNPPDNSATMSSHTGLSPYTDIMAFLLGDENYVREMSDFVNYENTNINNNNRIQIDFGNNKRSFVYINKIKTERYSAGSFVGIYNGYYGKYDLNEQVYGDFTNYDITITASQMPEYDEETFPEYLKEYAVIEPEETSNYFLWDGKEWNNLTYNGLEIKDMINTNSLPTIGYSLSNTYIVSKLTNNIVDCLNQAFFDGNDVVYIEGGEYQSNSFYTLPAGNFKIIGLGDVYFNFSIDENLIEGQLDYSLFNIKVNHIAQRVENGGNQYYMNSLKLYNCSINSISGVNFYAENTNFYGNSTWGHQYMSGVYEKCNFYNSTELRGYSFNNCNFYLNSSILFSGYRDTYGFNLEDGCHISNCNFYLTKDGLECREYDGGNTTRPINEKVITNSNFPYYCFSNIEAIDLDSCYINDIAANVGISYKGTVTSQEFEKIDGINGDLYNIEDNAYSHPSNNDFKYEFDINKINNGTKAGYYLNYIESFDENKAKYELSGSLSPDTLILSNLFGLIDSNTNPGVTGAIIKNSFEKKYIEFLILDGAGKIQIYFNDIIEISLEPVDYENIEGETAYYYIFRLKFFAPTDQLVGNEYLYYINNIITYDVSGAYNYSDIEQYCIFTDNRILLGKTNVLKLKNQNNWINLLSPTTMNYRGMVEQYSYLPNEKNVGDVYRTNKKEDIETSQSSGTFLGYKMETDSSNESYIQTMHTLTQPKLILYPTTELLNCLKENYGVREGITVEDITSLEIVVREFTYKTNVNIQLEDNTLIITSDDELVEQDNYDRRIILGNVPVYIKSDILDEKKYQSYAKYKISCEKGSPFMWNGKEWEYLGIL